MKPRIILSIIIQVLVFKGAMCQTGIALKSQPLYDYAASLKDTLLKLAGQSENAFFQHHCNSIILMISSQEDFTEYEMTHIENLYKSFHFQSLADPKLLSTYTDRMRPMIIAWESPTDHEASFSWLQLPKNWDPDKEYPLYIQLHGLWNVAENAFEYLAYPYVHSPSASYAFEDGYLLSPWGRGNLWYHGISETDIWECMAALEKIAKINPVRKYLSGHSMGGYGAWRIASHSPDTWAALGIHAGALQSYENLVTETHVQKLKSIPTYIVCGRQDFLLELNQTAYYMLWEAGNTSLNFVTFDGGHEYIERNVQNMYDWMKNFENGRIVTGIPQTFEARNQMSVTCFPNPVASAATIKISGVKHEARLDLYDMQGRFITKLANFTTINGDQGISFDASLMRPGTYIIRLTSGTISAETKMTIAY